MDSKEMLKHLLEGFMRTTHQECNSGFSEGTVWAASQSRIILGISRLASLLDKLYLKHPL